MSTLKPVKCHETVPIVRQTRGSVYQIEDGSWWFYDETRTNVHGPFKWECQARKWLYLYCKELNDGPTI